MSNSSINNSCLPPDQAKEDYQEVYRKHIRSVILILDDKNEYDRIKDLADIVSYQSKLMACYGFDVGSGRWDSTKFPVTKTDLQMEGIQSDIKRFNDAVQHYNEYAEYLATKYDIDIHSELRKGHNVIFRPPEPTSMEK